MTQGIYINYQRPKSKKEIKEAIAAGKKVSLEATDLFGKEYDGPVTEAPDGKYFFVGPDPYTKRNFYGQIVKSGDTVKVL